MWLSDTIKGRNIQRNRGVIKFYSLFPLLLHLCLQLHTLQGSGTEAILRRKNNKIWNRRQRRWRLERRKESKMSIVIHTLLLLLLPSDLFTTLLLIPSARLAFTLARIWFGFHFLWASDSTSRFLPDVFQSLQVCVSTLAFQYSFERKLMIGWWMWLLAGMMEMRVLKKESWRNISNRMK